MIVAYGRDGQKEPRVSYNSGLMLDRVADAGGIGDDALAAGTARSTLAELLEWPLLADKMLVC